MEKKSSEERDVSPRLPPSPHFTPTFASPKMQEKREKEEKFDRGIRDGTLIIQARFGLFCSHLLVVDFPTDRQKTEKGYEFSAHP